MFFTDLRRFSHNLHRVRAVLPQRKTEPVITVYETQANLADHEKIPGTEGNLSASGT